MHSKLYYCTSVYQLINIINIHLFHTENNASYSGGLILSDKMPNNEILALKIKDECIFDSVYISHNTNNKGFFSSRIIKKCLNERLYKFKNKYDCIITSKIARVLSAI